MSLDTKYRFRAVSVSNGTSSSTSVNAPARCRVDFLFLKTTREQSSSKGYVEHTLSMSVVLHASGRYLFPVCKHALSCIGDFPKTVAFNWFNCSVRAMRSSNCRVSVTDVSRRFDVKCSEFLRPNDFCLYCCGSSEARLFV